jgi:mono/diheme cytochrome c family protein
MNIYQMKLMLLFVGIFFVSLSRGDEGKDLFKLTCAACHTIGQGRLVGPDLLNVSDKHSQEWMVSFIKSSTSMINSGDAKALTIFQEYNKLLMPDNTYSDGQIINILTYINEGGSGSDSSESQLAVDMLDGTTSENISRGLKLFSGSQQFENGGATCTSCHKVRDDRIFSSGTLAKDLSESYDLMRSAGVAAIIKNPPFPVMLSAYKNHQLTEEEILDLTAYLRSVSEERIYSRPNDFSLVFASLGFFVFMMIFMSMIILYFKRKRLAVNHKILSRPSKVVN